MAGVATLSILLCAAVVGLVRLLPGIDSWADLGLRRTVPLRHWWSAVFLAAAASNGHVAVQWLSQMVGSAIAERSGSPALLVPAPTEFPADIARSIHTSISEEILLFAVPIALGALAWRKVRGYKYLPARVQRAIILAATGLYVIGIRTKRTLVLGVPGGRVNRC